MKTHTLTASLRSETGKKVKLLRKKGILPATVYGKSVKSISVSIKNDDFASVLAAAGETGLVDLVIGKDKRPVLIHSVQRHAVTGDVLHIEFHQVDLKENVRAKIPVKFEGESPAIAQKLGVLLTILDEVEVEALPTELPEHVVVDIGILTEVDREIKVNNLVFQNEVKVLTDPDLTVVKVGPLITKQQEAQVAAEEAQAVAKEETQETQEPEAKTEESPKPTEEVQKTEK